MPRLAYVNGSYIAISDARVSVEDRGFQFADGVYEVVAVFNRTLLDWPAHLERLARSRTELEIAAPTTDAVLSAIAGRLLAANRIRDGLLYIQLTRGTARRDHPFPPGIKPTLVMTARPFDFRQRLAQQTRGLVIVTHAEQRWARRDIKSVSLLPNIIAKQAAKRAGAFEAWFVEDGTVTEGSSTNAWIVREDRVITHPPSHAILSGVMRGTLLRLLRAQQITVEERPFSLADAISADEAFMTSTTAPCLPVVGIDDRIIGTGRPGPMTAKLAGLLWNEIGRQTGWRR